MKRCTSTTGDRNLVRITAKLVKEHEGASELNVAGNIALRVTMHRYIQEWATSVRFLVSSHFCTRDNIEEKELDRCSVVLSLLCR